MNHLTNKIGQLLSGLSSQTKVPALGERELEVMKILWQGQPLSAKQVLHSISDRELSLSTMQSTLERLYRKKLLHREKAGRFFVYQAAVSRAQVISQLLGDITEQICDGDVTPLVSGFTRFYGEKATSSELDDHNKLTHQLPDLTDDKSAD